MVLPLPDRKLLKVPTPEPALADALRMHQNLQAFFLTPLASGGACLQKQHTLDITPNFSQDQRLFSCSSGPEPQTPRSDQSPFCHSSWNSAAPECSPFRVFAFRLSTLLFFPYVLYGLAEGFGEHLRAAVSSWQAQEGVWGTECWWLRP